MVRINYLYSQYSFNFKSRTPEKVLTHYELRTSHIIHKNLKELYVIYIEMKKRELKCLSDDFNAVKVFEEMDIFNDDVIYQLRHNAELQDLLHKLVLLFVYNKQQITAAQWQTKHNSFLFRHKQAFSHVEKRTPSPSS